MSEKSGIQMIKELVDNIAILDRRMQTIEQNMKLLLSRKNSSQPKLEGLKLNNNPARPTKIQGQIRLESKKEKPPIVKAASNARVVGRIRDRSGKVAGKVNVSIFDDRNNLVKTTRTNNAGDLFAFLPPGKYIMELKKDNVLNENIVFTVGIEDKVVEIKQPQ